jgi:predicted nuclease of predicted toxin-antitoxin system
MSDLQRKLPKLLKLLSSDNDGEVLAAARAIGRLLDSGEADFHDLAALYENNGIVEQRFARANISQFDPAGERALDHCARI